MPPGGQGRGGSMNFVVVGILIFWSIRSPCLISEPCNNPFWEKIKELGEKEREKEEKQAGAELCQAQEKLWLPKPYLVRNSSSI